MMKKSYLTPVLAGVLAVAVVGSGAAYYFNFVKDTDGDKNSAEKKSNAITVDEAAATIEAQLDKAQQIANGELDGGYSAEISYTAPESGDLSGAGNISLTMDAKQKDKASEMDYALSYNSQGIISANVVYDNENETAYLQIPELSDAYLSGTADDINSLLQSATSGLSSSNDYSSYIEDDDTYTASAYTQNGAVSVPLTATSSSLDSLKDVDFEALLTDAQEYADVVIENAPTPTDGENKKGEVDGVSYDLTTKTYTITASDALKIFTAVAEKGKSDEVLKNALTSMGVSEDDYNSIWTELTDIDESSDETVQFDVYYSGEDVAGWGITADGETYYMVTATTDTNVVLDWDITEGSDSFTAKGAVGIDGDTLDGKVSIDYASGSSKDNVLVTFDKLTVTDTAVNGTISYVLTENDSELATISVEMNNTDAKSDTSVKVSINGEDAGTVKITSQQTDATDISIPTGTIYKLSDDTELQAYVAGCDITGWQETLKTALGDETYNALFGASTDDFSSYDDYSTYSVDDYDF